MEVIIGRDSVQANRIKIRGQNAEINGRNYNASHNVVIPVGDDFLDIFLLYENFCLIKKKFNFTSIDLILESDSTNFEVNYEYDGSHFNYLYISVGEFYLSRFNESDLLTFLAHELGHLFDIKNIYNSDKYFNFKKKILKYIYILIIILLTSWLKSKSINNILLTAYFVLSNILLSLTINVLLRYKQAVESRKQEYSADIYAVKIMGDLSVVLSAYEKLQIVMQEPVSKSIFSSHPSINQRIKKLKFRYWYLVIWNKIFSH